MLTESLLLRGGALLRGMPFRGGAHLQICLFWGRSFHFVDIKTQFFSIKRKKLSSHLDLFVENIPVARFPIYCSTV